MPIVKHAYTNPVADDATSSWVMPSHWNASHTILGYTYKDTLVLTTLTSTTMSMSASVQGINIQMWGAGGGGAGASASALNAAAGASGGGGGYCKLFIGAATITSTYYYKCGTAGTGGASGSNPGVAGGTTWFGEASPGTFTALGGAGGVAITLGTSAVSTAAALGGSASNGQWMITGQSGGKGIRYSGTVYFTDMGGNSALAPGRAGYGGPLAGATAQGYGHGGGGAAQASTGNAKGGDGGPGLILIDQYY